MAEMSDNKTNDGLRQENCELPREIVDVMDFEGKIEELTSVSNAEEAKEMENVSIKRIESMYEHLSEQMTTLEQLFNKRIMHAEYEDKIIDRMHEELQRYKEDLYSQLVRPILLDIIEIRDSIIRNAAIYHQKPEGEQNIPNKLFTDYSYDLQDILERNNVEIYRSERGDSFVPVRQRAVKKEVTNDETLHGKIAESLSGGYSYGGRVISAEKVSVFLYEKMEESKSESEDNANG